MNQLPETGFLTLKQIIGDRKANPPIPALIPVSKSTLEKLIKTGEFPPPKKIGGGKINYWWAADIRESLHKLNQGENDK